ncbi:hypothetical protein EBZ39_16350 [bacterium]|nr:hypothetical protein [bacterium]
MTIPEALAYLRTLCIGGPPSALNALDELEAAWRREQDRPRISRLGGQSTSDAKREAARRKIKPNCHKYVLRYQQYIN